ncbi:hypothetical protein [Salmonella enterica]|uniref:hypothetical protein n=1 Tax=Salmonella enterica TaxID=28901 RepID=UPI003F4BBE7F
MLALRQTLDLTASQNLTLEYGIARLDGDGSKTAGDNGLTGGYSQFFGLKHSMAFDEGLAWNNSLRYDVHITSTAAVLSPMAMSIKLPIPTCVSSTLSFAVKGRKLSP